MTKSRISRLERQAAERQAAALARLSDAELAQVVADSLGLVAGVLGTPIAQVERVFSRMADDDLSRLAAGRMSDDEFTGLFQELLRQSAASKFERFVDGDDLPAQPGGPARDRLGERLDRD